MDISINGTPVKEMYPGALNLEDILVRLSSSSVPTTHLVSSVMVNGRLFSEVYPGQAREIGIEKISELKIDTVSLEQVATASLKDCVVFVDRIAASALKTAELFRM